MKNILCFVLLLMILACTNSKNPQRDENGKVLKNGQFYDSQEAETNMVWVCVSKTSHAYHSTDKCYGIMACKGKIQKISLTEAISGGRTPCHYCHKETAAYDDEEDCEDCEDCEEEKDPYDPDYYDPLEDPDVRKFTNEKGELIAEVVYVCSGSDATKYHSDPYCSGLSNCLEDINELYVPEAEYKGYEPCKRCYE